MAEKIEGFARALSAGLITAFAISGSIVCVALTCNRRVGIWWARKIWGPGMLWIVGIPMSSGRIEVRGLENIDPTQPQVYVMNHQSLLDIAIVYSYLPQDVWFIAKKELMWMPFVGLYIWAMGMIFIDRRNQRRAFESLEKAALIVRGGRSIFGFPEGTRSFDGIIKPFKKGIFNVAIAAKVPIIPLAVDGPRFLLPKHSLVIQKSKAALNIGKPIDTAVYSLAQKDTLIEATRNEVERLFKEIEIRK